MDTQVSTDNRALMPVTIEAPGGVNGLAGRPYTFSIRRAKELAAEKPCSGQAASRIIVRTGESGLFPLSGKNTASSPFEETRIGQTISNSYELYTNAKTDYERSLQKMDKGECKPWIVEKLEGKMKRLEDIVANLGAIPPEAAIAADVMEHANKSFSRIICLFAEYGQVVDTDAQARVSELPHREGVCPPGIVIDYLIRN